MANRKGVFIGAYVPNELKESLRRRAAASSEATDRDDRRRAHPAVASTADSQESCGRLQVTRETLPVARSLDVPVSGPEKTYQSKERRDGPRCGRRRCHERRRSG